MGNGRGMSWSWLRRVAEQPRVLLAAKTAAAAALAWYLAPLLPFTDDKYSYYAPLGVVVSMYPTLVRSFRTGLQSLAALAIGIGVGMIVIAVPIPRVVGMVVAVGAGVLLAGLRFLGSANSWVPIAAMFVLLVGGGHAEDYSLNYLVNVIFGILVGIVVNYAIAPAVPAGTAKRKLDTLRDRVAGHVRRLATALENSVPNRAWGSALQRLDDTAEDVRNAVHRADESRRGNPRGRRMKDQLEQDYRRLRALERVLFLVRDATDIVGRADPSGETASSVLILRTEVATALHAVAELVDSPVGSEQAPQRMHEAQDAVAAVERSADEHLGQPSKAQDADAISLALRRIIEAARPFVAAE